MSKRAPKIARTSMPSPVRIGQWNNHRNAFTLIESAVAIIIVGLGVAAIMVSTASGSRVNDIGTKLTKATFLAQEIHEWTIRLPFKDLDPGDANNPPGPDGLSSLVFVDDLDDLLGTDLQGTMYDPPRNGQGSSITDMAGWSQDIDLTWRNPADLTSIVANGSSGLVFVEVSISWKTEEMLKIGWLISEKD